MSLTLRFLGTSASRPTVERNVSSLAITREGETLMFDCGEGTQRQMMRYGISFALSDIFFTHMHADHMLGLTGLLRTLALQGRTEPMNLYGPVGCEKLLWRAIMLGSEKQPFEIKIVELTPEAPLKAGYSIIPFPVEHGDRRAIGYHLAEETRLGRFNPDKAREMGIPEGPLWGKIHKGETVSLPDGRTVKPSELVGPTRPGRRASFSPAIRALRKERSPRRRAPTSSSTKRRSPRRKHRARSRPGIRRRAKPPRSRPRPA